MISDYISPRFGMGTTHLSDLTSGRTLDNVLDGCVARIMRVADEEHGSGAANLPAVQMRAIMQHQVGYAGLSLTARTQDNICAKPYMNLTRISAGSCSPNTSG
jgi:hypothetical protein